MKYLILVTFLVFGHLNADFWEDATSKGSEYYNKAKAYDKEYNISNRVKSKSGEYYDKAKAYDKEHNISNTVKDKVKNGWNSFKSLF